MKRKIAIAVLAIIAVVTVIGWYLNYGFLEALCRVIFGAVLWWAISVVFSEE